ncbi:MAG: hypothetical protein JJ892_06480 [Balneola sp.]|nr:hypothetical protein [Balneola sp.]MBO6649936.1 hypothetical protein [Balneola sp.]MBO6711716.1 hypothetical protein [Balneola sp.]MBO6799910.1 hypothetical protein [Balneola sp.]MBO6871155.1 hypothetical protein [Balneola sp.]
MDQKNEAYHLPIKEGKVRIVFNVDEIQTKISNSIEDFFSQKDDIVRLFLDLGDLNIKGIKSDGYELVKNSSRKSPENSFALPEDSIWFDVDIEQVSTILNNSIKFIIQGSYSEHVRYFIDKMDYKIEWLQYDKGKDEISTVSVTKRTYSQPRLEQNISYELDEIAKSAELLHKAINRIDLRTRSAYVKLNTGEGRLDPVIIIIAEKLGYEVKVLDEETVSELRKRGQKATHLISLVINY